jgi:AcrR family transcriptional regulator
MPPKVKFSKEHIIDIAFAYVRKNGWAGLTVRYLAKQLNASTMPIYSCFASMRHLEEEIVKKAMHLFFEYITKPRSDDLWIDHAVGYVLFAKEETHLFRAVFDEDHGPIRKRYDAKIWKQLGDYLVSYPPFKDLSESQIYALRRGRWVLIHGLAGLVNTAQLSISDEHEIRQTVETASNVLLSGVKANLK